MIGDNVRTLRKALKLSQTAFGERIGVSRDVVNNIERDRSSIPDSQVKLIGLAYHVSEDWLRTGAGEMFEETTDTLAAKYQLSEFEQRLLELYAQLDNTQKDIILDFLAKVGEAAAAAHGKPLDLSQLATQACCAKQPKKGE